MRKIIDELQDTSVSTETFSSSLEAYKTGREKVGDTPVMRRAEITEVLIELRNLRNFGEGVDATKFELCQKMWLDLVLSNYVATLVLGNTGEILEGWSPIIGDSELVCQVAATLATTGVESTFRYFYDSDKLDDDSRTAILNYLTRAGVAIPDSSLRQQYYQDKTSGTNFLASYHDEAIKGRSISGVKASNILLRMCRYFCNPEKDSRGTKQQRFLVLLGKLSKSSNPGSHVAKELEYAETSFNPLFAKHAYLDFIAELATCSNHELWSAVVMFERYLQTLPASVSGIILPGCTKPCDSAKLAKLMGDCAGRLGIATAPTLSEADVLDLGHGGASGAAAVSASSSERRPLGARFRLLGCSVPQERERRGVELTELVGVSQMGQGPRQKTSA